MKGKSATEKVAMSKSSTIFRRLSDFIQNEMRMSHVYQPVMLRALLIQ